MSKPCYTGLRRLLRGCHLIADVLGFQVVTEHRGGQDCLAFTWMFLQAGCPQATCLTFVNRLCSLWLDIKLKAKVELLAQLLMFSCFCDLLVVNCPFLYEI